MRSVAAKIGIRERMKVYLLHAPDDFVKTIKPMHLEIAHRLTGEFDYIHFFSKNNAELKKLPAIKEKAAAYRHALGFMEKESSVLVLKNLDHLGR